MSVQVSSSKVPPPAQRWRLWVDGCGGFLLLPGNRWTVGGIDQHSPADICVRADWPRRAGAIDRDGADYFWQSSNVDQPRQLINSGQPLPVGGSAEMTLHCPSPLSTSATLSLHVPHRFGGHVDGAILVDETVLIGRASDCHICVNAEGLADCPSRTVLVFRSGQWRVKEDGHDFRELKPGVRFKLRSLAFTLEEA